MNLRGLDNSTHRTVTNDAKTKSFRILKAGTECGIEIETKSDDHTWNVDSNAPETQQLIQALLKKE